MRIVRVFIVIGVVLGLVPQALGQPKRAAGRPRGAAKRAGHQRYEIHRDQIRERQDADAAEAQAATLEKSEHTKAIAQEEASVTQQYTALQMQQRLVLVNGQLKKLEDEKKAALEAGKSAEEIAQLDAQMDGLTKEAAALRASLGLPVKSEVEAAHTPVP